MSLSAACYAAGYATGAIAFVMMAKARKLLTDGVYLIMLSAIIGGLICATAAQHVLGGGPGKTILGGFAGGYLCVVIAKRVLGMRRPLGDLFAVAICAGEAVGRWGCFFGGCCYGKACSLPWAVWQHGAYRHPTQIYMSVSNFCILALLLVLARRSPPENALFYTQGLLYCASRFLIEIFRETPAPIAGLTTAQWACIAGAAYFGCRLTRLMPRILETKHALPELQ